MTERGLSLEQRFWMKVDKREPDECWEWLAGTTGEWYGVFNRGDSPRVEAAHRFSWEIHNGPIPKGMCVLHHCDNPICVNPRHLFLGTQTDNNHDRDQKERQARGARAGSSKLTKKKVCRVRRLLKEGWSQSKIARLMGVSQVTIHSIDAGKTWAWFQDCTEQEQNNDDSNIEIKEAASMTIGERIKSLRTERGWTRRTLSSLTGFTEKAISDWEGGKYVPSERGIRALEKAFGEQLRN